MGGDENISDWVLRATQNKQVSQTKLAHTYTHTNTRLCGHSDGYSTAFQNDTSLTPVTPTLSPCRVNLLSTAAHVLSTSGSAVTMTHTIIVSDRRTTQASTHSHTLISIIHFYTQKHPYTMPALTLKQYVSNSLIYSPPQTHTHTHIKQWVIGHLKRLLRDTVSLNHIPWAVRVSFARPVFCPFAKWGNFSWGGTVSANWSHFNCSFIAVPIRLWSHFHP